MSLQRWAKRIVIGTLLVVGMILAAGVSYQWLATRRDLKAHPPPGRLVNVGGFKLHILCSGLGNPTVILDSGLGGSFVDWGFVQPEVAKFTQVCSYDRAGLGYSDRGPSPRTAQQISNELARLLVNAGIRGKVVLVGASLGGFNMRVFASTHEENASGLILVDASHEDQRIDIPAIAPFVPLLSQTGAFRLLDVTFGQPVNSLPPDLRESARVTNLRASSYQAARSELLHARESADQVRATRHQLKAPVIVISAGRNTEAEWRAFQQDQVGLAERGCQIIAEGSGHVIPLSQPQTVVKAIRSVVDASHHPPDQSLCG